MPAVGRLCATLLVATAISCAGLASAPALAQPAVPALTGRVVDRAGILTAATEETLEWFLARLEEDSGPQLVVLTVPSLAGETIESLAFRAAESWRLGSAERDDGVLLVLAVEERRARIEVGYGLEEVLPDVVAGRIIREAMVPHFRRGDYDAGVLAGVQRIAERVSPEELLAPARTEAGSQAGPSAVQKGSPGSVEPAALSLETNWEHLWVWVVFLLLMPLMGSPYALVAKQAETRGIVFGVLLLPILLGGSLVTDELVSLPPDSGKFLLGGVAGVLIFSVVFWWLHFRLARRPELRGSWRQHLDALADGRILFAAAQKAGLKALAGRQGLAIWVRRSAVALFYAGVGWLIARYWHPGYAVFYFHNLFWLFVTYRSTLHPAPASDSAWSWSASSSVRRSSAARTSRRSASAGGRGRRFRGGGGSFGGGGASGSW